MSRKRKTITMYDLVAHLATKRDLQALERKTLAGFDQLMGNLSTLLNLMEREVQRSRRRSKKTIH